MTDHDSTGEPRSDSALPLLLLDVDGVLNALSIVPDWTVWDDWQTGWATAQGRQYRIQWSPTVVATIRSWIDQGLAEVRWLTTWRDDAPRSLAPLIGMPELAVVGGQKRERILDGHGLSHAEDAGAAAADPSTGRWWKLDLVAELLEREPGRPIVWIDDDHERYPEASVFLRSRGLLARTIAPASAAGLGPLDLDSITFLLERWNRCRRARA